MKVSIREKDIKTVAYNIRQIYDYQDGERIFRGYEVTNIFEISIKDIERVGEIIDTVVTNGANYIGNIDFRVSNQSLYYKQALTLAVKDAAVKAREIAITIGVTVNEIPSEITEVNYSSLCFPPQRPVFRAPEEITPISPGQQEICARVKAVFNY